MAIKELKNYENYLGFQRHIVRGETRYRVGIKFSVKYAFVIVISFDKQDVTSSSP